MPFTPAPTNLPSRRNPANFDANAEAAWQWLAIAVAELAAAMPGESAAALAQYLASSTSGNGAALVAYLSGTVHTKLREQRSLTEGMSAALRDAVLGITPYTDQFRADMLSACASAWDAALAGGWDLRAPSGQYQIGDANFPWRNTGAGLLDCKGIAIYGDGPTTVFSTYSPDGADPFQLNAVKRLRIRNLHITATLTAFLDAGSNGISITSGWDDIVIEGVTVENLPGVQIYAFTVSAGTAVVGGSYTVNSSTYRVRNIVGSTVYAVRTAGSSEPPASGTLTGTPNLTYTAQQAYIDGGKALTVQPGTTANECGALRARIHATGCAEGAGLDVDLVTMSAKAASIDIDVTADSCYRAFKFSASAATGAISAAADSGITARVKAVNCQQDVLLARAHGIRVDAQIVTSKTAAARRLSPSGAAWVTADTVVEALRCEYAKNADVKVRGNKGACDYKARLGGAAAGSSGLGGATEYCDIDLDIGGTAAIADIAEINSGGNTMNSSRLRGSARTASSIPVALGAAARGNDIRTGSIYTGSYTATLAGCTTAPTFTVEWTMNGDVVTLEIPECAAISNTGTASLSGMPDSIKPTSLQSDEGPVINNGVYGIGVIQIANTGVIVLCANMNPTSYTGFTASGTKGIGATTITYRRS